ncbi:MAG: glycoside hydrolase [Bacteroidaceae bacterium]|nr:glycoside hydrolase [Bacteroidaceae bacterium]
MKRVIIVLMGWLITSSLKAANYTIDVQQVRQHWDGWGVSLCWWAGQCGKWDDEKVDEIISWLVSPEGLNYSHFRYNIGGGDDPENRNCEPHHMGKGKGLRAEMEGFKDFTGDQYHWERDSAQRRVMLKIKEKRPDAVFEAFSNSCPYYMTFSGCVAGNKEGGKDNLKPEYYEEFAHYLVDVCKHYKEQYGIEFKTLEPFNESATSYWYQNGSQEGCHFDYSSQIAFLRVLAPILQKSGLKTIISASDETSVEHSIKAFQAYKEAGILPLVGQWNTHTYQGDNRQRRRLSSMVREAGLPFWMSETGSGGRGLEGNLKLTQRLFDDIRIMQPEAWLDWQYMEERSDQWCTINGSFQWQFYRKVKNFYVRQQCSRFIKRGYDILQTDCPQALAAINPSRDTLTLVLLNEGNETTHNIQIQNYRFKKGKVYRTSASENQAEIKQGFRLKGKSLSIVLPQQSITTLLIPIH